MSIETELLLLLLPELTLVIAGAIMMLAGTWSVPKSAIVSTGIAGFVVALWVIFQQQAWAVPHAVVSGPLMIDTLGGTMRLMSCVVGLLFLLAIARNAATTQFGEMLGMVQFVFAGLMLTCWTNNLVLLLVALELISIPTYVLLFLSGRQPAAAESTTKYFFLSILSSAILLFGVSMLFGVTGQMEFTSIGGYFNSVGSNGGPAVQMVVVSLVMIFCGLAFKIAAVPFHFYAPDVYQLTSNANAGLLAVVPKIAGIVVMIRVLSVVVPSGLHLGWQCVVVVSIVTMTLGNVCALWQNNIRRMMAYSSIAHAGYMLIGLAVTMSGVRPELISDGVSATLLYLAIYSIASLGVFAVLCEVSGDQETNDVWMLQHLSGLGRCRPWMAGGMAIFMFSLAGIPPLAGFWGKMTLFTTALATSHEAESLGGHQRWFLWLAIVGVVNAAIAAAYYLRVIGFAYFRAADPDDPPAPLLMPRAGSASLTVLFCAALLVIVGLMPGNVVDQFRRMGQPQAIAGASEPTSLIVKAPPQQATGPHLSRPQTTPVHATP